MSQKAIPVPSPRVGIIANKPSVVGNVEKKFQDLGSAKGSHSRLNNRRDLSLNGSSKHDCNRKQIVQPYKDKFKTSNSKYFTSNERFADAFEMGSVFNHGRRKQNLNHLLNFHYEKRNDSSNHRMNKQSHRNIKFNKEQYLLANCQFVFGCNIDQSEYSRLPDLLNNWDKIEQIKILSVGFSSCPICLYSPKAAKMTRCGHIYCWSCILHYLSLSDNSHRSCPICYQSINKKDLKSVVAKDLHFYSLGDKISFRLIESNFDSINIHIFGEQYGNNDNEIYSQFLHYTPDKILKIIDREKRELNDQFNEDPECPEICFIQLAMDYLSERENEILQNLSDVTVDKHNSEVDFDRIHKKFYFYQVIDGQHIYLHSLNMKMLEHSFGDVTNFPTTIHGTVVEKENVLIDSEYNSRFRYLQHLPLNSYVEIIEIQFDPETVKHETVLEFKEKLEIRQQKRQQKADNERKHEERVAQDELNWMKQNHGIYIEKKVSEKLELESDIEFPVVHSDIISSSPSSVTDNSYLKKTYAKTLTTANPEFKSLVQKSNDESEESSVPDYSKSLSEALENISIEDNLLAYREGKYGKKKKKVKYIPLFSTNMVTLKK